MNTVRVLNTDITDTTINEVSEMLNNSSGNTVAICNANTLVQCVKNNDINSVINSFTVASPDGFPVAKAISKLAKKNIKRVDGYKVFKKTIEEGLKIGTSHYFFGSSERVVSRMISNLKKEYPAVNISGYTCPPVENVEDLVNTFNKSIGDLDPDIVWVSLGFPKQEMFIDSLLKNSTIQSNFVLLVLLCSDIMQFLNLPSPSFSSPGTITHISPPIAFKPLLYMVPAPLPIAALF